jgi:GntR family transcriptional repressor for pyruvate dehydrogenase complex
MTSPRGAETSVADIERSLTLDILRGRFAKGSRLPTVRDLAATHGVNPSTIQRVVARLEARGIVEARQGSGLHVNDPADAGDVGLVPYWLVALEDEPTRAIRILDDFLELRRSLAVRLLVRHRDDILARTGELSGAAAALGAADPSDLPALVAADLGFARALLRITGNVVALSVFNTLAKVLHESPRLVAAMYATPVENARAMGRVLAALAKGGPKAEATIDAILRKIDATTVSRFARSFEQGGRP